MKTKAPKKIEAYTYTRFATNEQVQQPVATPPNPGGHAHTWRQRRCFYVSVRDGSRYSLLVGPFPAHQEALDMVSAARNAAEQVDSRAFWYSYGTCSLEKGEREGLLNKMMGYVPPEEA
jgi:hypothetical protein